ncbi:Response regulator receiver domain-containing protein [Desulfatibacillum alkenivorans DSM 16219]|jgi:DNA-binding NtrC family response regulator|uniref:Response regulator receiver domain-containing protein n=1 Tax=Desulfatibacillum alkenivorans DSM 16219 TaxID=1121393 RepID=A0A1M6DVM7_9BACT|nr:response regulator [Desulfatibacillum alkenivorans]SHI77304.1 Response regulator receiver domain-containing protein [Desulfatibacillum alkenivorans DSM 16219]
MCALHALVVDDETSARMLLERGVANAGFSVESAEDGVQAANMIRKKLYDLVVTDLMMPGEVDGVGVLEAAKARSPRTSVVLITGHASVETAVEAMKKGADDYLQKPIHLDELAIKIGRVRDLNLLVRDSQELQEAMDVTESSAAETIRELDAKVSELQLVLDSVRGILSSEAPHDRKIVKALEALAEPNT